MGAGSPCRAFGSFSERCAFLQWTSSLPQGRGGGVAPTSNKIKIPYQKFLNKYHI